jgi:hypothetical protein
MPHATMLCRRCSARHEDTLPPDLGALAVCVVAGVLCARCGTMLGPEDHAARLVIKLAQLNRFGLAGREVLLRRPPAPSPFSSGPKDF